MECSLTLGECLKSELVKVLILIQIEKTNTQSQRAEGSSYLLANVGKILMPFQDTTVSNGDRFITNG